MSISLGIGLAFIAMLCWGFGEFLIQKSSRKIGDVESLFLITLIGAIILLPFVWKDIFALITGGIVGNKTLAILLAASIILLIAAITDFEGLKRGKLAVVEPIWSFEVPVSAAMAFIILGERVSLIQILLIVLLLIFLAMVGFRNKKLDKTFFFEKGVFVAFLGAVFMGVANFMMGWGGRVSSPLMVNFFTDAFIMIIMAILLMRDRKLAQTFRDLKKNIAVMLPMSISDKVAWVAFVFAMTLAPIAVATALSESYIIVAVILGLFINHEKIHAHQRIGLVGAVAVAIVLAILTSA